MLKNVREIRKQKAYDRASDVGIFQYVKRLVVVSDEYMAWEWQ